ncbi:Fe-S cluster assembly ATPase SufC [Sodalis-like secondary symbiont of Drepanosiphum platanoidis]|uniref:Fe-S cluster assembly ATPase SufC n=1 Tax=Sodalis-like secondary symbiont of Drepanosiphum platanoidis TaxID=2994493 RepID=UPI003464B956
MLFIENLHVDIEKKKILQGINLIIKPQEIHVIMGPNGSGKSTLSATLTGREDCNITKGNIFFQKKNLCKLNIEERACEGIFLAFQYPVEIPGISNSLFLQTSINSIRKYNKKNILDKFEFLDLVEKKIKMLNMSKDLLNRFVNVGFSGGEKKINDILQMAILEPKLCILDETDSGLDIDAIKIISKGINSLRTKNRSFIIITHYKRILDYIKPDKIHILYKGRIIKSGDLKLVKYIEEKGYGNIIKS